MGPKATAVLNYVSHSIYNVRQSCVTSAIAAQTVAVDGAQEINISGLDMHNQATTHVGECTETSQLDMQNIYGGMDALRSRIQVAAAGMEGTRDTFVVSLKSAVTVDVVNQCVARAVSATSVMVNHAGGTVTFDNVKLTNMATASIQKCLQTVSVAGTPLEKFIEQNEAWMGAVAGAAPDASGGIPSTLQAPDSAKATKVFPPCSQFQKQRDLAWFATAVVGVLGITASLAL